MTPNTPHFYLRSEALPAENGPAARWRFVLTRGATGERFEASDDEPAAHGERLELLAAVLGLEALDQPSRVTLSTASRFVYLGVMQGVQRWRADGWQWERFGELAPVKHRDLWQRMALALDIHQVDCRLRGRAPTPSVPATQQKPNPVSEAARPRRTAGPVRRKWRFDDAHSGRAARVVAGACV
jgi:ribonuclease HI